MRIFLVLMILFALAAQSYGTSENESFLSSTWSEPQNAHFAEENFIKTEAVFKYFKTPHEAQSQIRLRDLDGLQSFENISEILNSVDTENTIVRFTNIDQYKITSFLDIDSKRKPDFEINFYNKETLKSLKHVQKTKSISFHKRILNVQRQFKKDKLKGLRIALDPGHMGDSHWDEMTGKFIQHEDGRRLSEGLLVLQTALLLEAKLKQLGAEVLITHRAPRPVTQMSYETLNINYFAGRELQASALTEWFQYLLQSAPLGDQLFSNFKNRQEFQNLYSENSRKKYYILREDLQARADMISKFKPDLTLVLHMDAKGLNGNGLNPEKYNKVKTFVFGNPSFTEWSSREQRALLARHLLNPYAWKASVLLSRHIVQSLSSGLNLEIENYDSNNSKPLEPGISMRNLYLTRHLTDAPTSYVECLYYDDPEEFNRLSNMTLSMPIDGKERPYSPRLAELATTLESGILNFVQSYKVF